MGGGIPIEFDRLGAMMLDTVLAAGVLLGAVALMMVASGQPARRCCLARAAFLGSLALIPLVALGPLRPRVDVASPVRRVFEPAVGPWPGQEPSKDQATVRVPGPLVRWVADRGRGLGRGLAAAYVFGVLAGLAWRALGWWGTCRLARRTIEPAPESLALYRGLPFRSWSWRRPRLRVSARVRRPVLVGTVFPTILVPPDFDEPEGREPLRLGLLHELAHAERADSWFSLAGDLAQAAWFVLPWVWWMRRQMRLDQEFLADHTASGIFGSFGAYASSLVELATPAPEATAASASPPAQVAGVSSFFGLGSALFLRVLMLVRCPYPVEARPPLWWRCALLPTIVAGTVLASSLSLRSAGAPAGALAGFAGPPGGCEACALGSVCEIGRGGQFQLARLVVAESAAGPDGVTRPHNLPMPLPPQFHLRLEVWAEPADLPASRVLGLRLGDPAAPRPRCCRSPAGWHKVEIDRHVDGLSTRVDGRTLAVPPTSPLGTAWLSVQPAPDRVGLYRNIQLVW